MADTKQARVMVAARIIYELEIDVPSDLDYNDPDYTAVMRNLPQNWWCRPCWRGDDEPELLDVQGV